MSVQTKAATDLLWAYQLKREHQHLLTRIQAIETASTRQDNRITATEQLADKRRDTDVSTLAKQVQALQDGGFKKRADLLEQKILDRLEDVQAEGEAICLKVNEMERGVLRREEDERKKTFQREKSLLKRIGECDTGLKKLTDQVVKLSERDHGGDVEALRIQVDEVKAALGKQVTEAKACLQGMEKLEQAQKELGLRVDGLKNEMAEIAAEASRRAQETFVPTQSLADLLPPPMPSQDDPLTQRPTQRPSRKKAAAPQPKQAVSHKTTMQKEVASLMGAFESGASANAPKTQKAVVRKGPGWYEVERTPSNQSRPRAAKVQPSIEDDQAETQSQNSQDVAKRRPGRPRKRKLTVIEDTQDEEGETPAADATTNSTMKVEKRKVAALPDDTDTQPGATHRQTRSQAARKARVPPGKVRPAKPSAATVARKVSEWVPKGPRKPAAPTKPAAAPPKRGPGCPRNQTTIQVASSEASTEIGSPSPAPAKTEKRPMPQQKTGRRRIELDGTNEEFQRKCREVLGQ